MMQHRLGAPAIGFDTSLQALKGLPLVAGDSVPGKLVRELRSCRDRSSVRPFQGRCSSTTSTKGSTTSIRVTHLSYKYLKLQPFSELKLP